MKIGLYGILGVYNFGCEAIVRGAVCLIQQVYPDAKILYFSRNYNFDSNALKDLNIEIVPIQSKRNIFNRGIYRICELFKIEKRPLFFDSNTLIDSVDEIWSIGGDLYTIPESKRNKSKYEYYNSTIDFCNRVVENGKDVVLYGASVGPFGNYTKAVDYYIGCLAKYKIILSREYETLDYLNSFNLKNVAFFPDPAFSVKNSLNYSCEKEYIGLNFSPLSMIELFGGLSDDNIIKFSNIIESIVDAFGYRILMIPHVVCTNDYDDDYKFQKKILDLVSEKYINMIEIADFSNGFLGIKKQLLKCVFVVSARMHLCLNAISENVPAIFLSYSSKSIGMCKYIYNSDSWLIDLKKLDKQLIPVMKNMFSQKEEVAKYLNNRNAEIKMEYGKLILDLFSV